MVESGQKNKTKNCMIQESTMGMKTPIEISDLLGGNILGILVVLTFLVDLNWLLD
jgi:CxxC motif-containing protein